MWYSAEVMTSLINILHAAGVIFELLVHRSSSFCKVARSAEKFVCRVRIMNELYSLVLINAIIQTSFIT